MGLLIYGNHEFNFDDRVLSHLKLAVGQKLARQESFFLSWVKPLEEGSGRVSIWVSPYVAMAFRFAGSRQPQINEGWVRAMVSLANTPRGLVVLTEAEAEKIIKQGLPLR